MTPTTYLLMEASALSVRRRVAGGSISSFDCERLMHMKWALRRHGCPTLVHRVDPLYAKGSITGFPLSVFILPDGPFLFFMQLQGFQIQLCLKR
mmetsp:Transcript_76331/g.134708  ORF Transcript_76331/g.134708 Transcript_76331/m.134708 type:complete len:94 (+) Transcript_76331:2-283(+)